MTMGMREDENDPPLPINPEDLLMGFWQYVNKGLPMDTLRELKQKTQQYLILCGKLSEASPVRQVKKQDEKMTDLSSFMD